MSLLPVLDIYQTVLCSLKLVINQYSSGVKDSDNEWKSAINPNAYYFLSR